MKLSFDRPATRKLELWATAHGINIDSAEFATELAALVVECAEKQLELIIPGKPEQKGDKP